MGKPLNVLSLPFPYIRNPYTPGSFLRLDAFQRQFTVICTGVMRLPEESPQFGCYTITAAYEVGHGALIEEAIALCTSRFNELHRYPKLSEAASFDPRTVEVYYTRPEASQQGTSVCDCGDVQRVLSGVVTASEIVWRRPCRTADEALLLKAQIEALLEHADESLRSDAFDSARLARRKARELKGFLVSPRWRALALKALNATGVTCCTH